MDRQYQSTVFSAFNRAKAAQRRGDLPTTQERLNRALGICLSRDFERYNTTIRSCNCADRRIHNITCKHMDALMIVTRAYEYMGRDWAAEQNLYVSSDGDTWVVEQHHVGRYTLHIFDDAEQAVDHMKRHTATNWTRPSSATGARVRPDEDHTSDW